MRCLRETLCILLIFAWGDKQATNAQTEPHFGDCKTPDKKDGTCIYFATCPVLNDILKKDVITPDERARLQASQCGYHDSKYLVCCPNVQSGVDRAAQGGALLPEIPFCSHETRPRTLEEHETELDDFPWSAMIEYTKIDKSRGFYCGGSLINERYVLAAAHCVKGRIESDWTPASVRLGEWHTKTNPDCVYDDSGNKNCSTPYIDVAIEEFIPHPHYLPSKPTSRNQYHDIALIRLAKPVQMTPTIKPICLPLEEGLRDASYKGDTLSGAGWGITKTGVSKMVKEITNLTVVEQTQCRNKYLTQKIALGSGQMCANGQQGDTCIVDSGGSLVHTHNADRRYYILAGIFSWGSKNCGLVEWPDVYTRVGQYIGWIRTNLKP